MFPLMRFKIIDKSMEPSFNEGDYIIARTILIKPVIEDVVIVKHDEIFMIKRIIKIDDDRYIVQGDNTKYSSPIAVKKEQIIGKVFFRIRH